MPGKARKNNRGAGPAAAKQQADFALKLTTDEQTKLAYLHTLADPWLPNPSQIPVALASNMSPSDMYQVRLSGTAKANSDGFAYVAIQADNWFGQASLSPMVTADSFQNGYPIRYTDENYVGTAIGSVAGSATGVGGHWAVPLPEFMTGLGTTDHVTLVSYGLLGYPVSSVDTTDGRIMVLRSNDPFSSLAFGRVTDETFTGLTAYDQDIIPNQIYSLSNWPNNTAVHVSGLPTAQHSLESYLPSGAGASITTNYAQLAIVIDGIATGDAIVWEAVFNYQVERGPSMRVESHQATVGSGGAPAGYHYEQIPASPGLPAHQKPIPNNRNYVIPSQNIRAMIHNAARSVMLPARLPHDTLRGVPRYRGSQAHSTAGVAAFATHLTQTQPGRWERIKAALRRGKKYLGDNWLRLVLQGLTLAAKFV